MPTRKKTSLPEAAETVAAPAAMSRTEAVHLALRQAIIEQALAPGARLPEDAIGETFGTSRTIAREALGRLAVEGLVELKQNRGAFVASPQLEEGRDMFVLRRGLERVVISLLSGDLSAADARKLRDHVERERKVSGVDTVKSMRLAGEFHLMLARMTDNPIVNRYVTEVVSRCSLIMSIYSRPHSSECAITEHEEIVDALVAGDAERASKIMDEHLDAVAGRALLQSKTARSIRDSLAPYASQLAVDVSPKE